MAVFDLLQPDQLHNYVAAPGVLIIDIRPANDYWAGHIPGSHAFESQLIALTRTDAASLQRFHQQLAWTLSTLGAARAEHAIVVGAENEVNVSRAAWALSYAGLPRVSVLDGGLAAWDGDTTTKGAPIQPEAFILNPRTEFIATAADVLQAIDKGTPILDAREWKDYSGETSSAARKGRIPSSLFWDTRNELNKDGHFSDTHEIKKRAESLFEKGDKAIIYCGGGGRAARTFLSLQLAGFDQVSVYPASWSEWGNVEAYPVDSTLLTEEART